MSTNPQARPHACAYAYLSGPGAARTARRTVTDALTALGALPEAVTDAELAASELAANAHEHATGPSWIMVFTAPGWVRVTVSDSAPRAHLTLPAPSPLPAQLDMADLDALEGDLTAPQGAASRAGTAERSRGLGIVATLAQGRCGVDYAARSKTVWFALALSQDAPAPPPHWDGSRLMCTQRAASSL